MQDLKLRSLILIQCLNIGPIISHKKFNFNKGPVRSTLMHTFITALCTIVHARLRLVRKDLQVFPLVIKYLLQFSHYKRLRFRIH